MVCGTTECIIGKRSALIDDMLLLHIEGTLNVRVVGDWLPRTILGKLWAVCAYVRMLYVAIVMLCHHQWDPFDAIFIDQISLPIPLLRLTRAKVCVSHSLFGCHERQHIGIGIGIDIDIDIGLRASGGVLLPLSRSTTSYTPIAVAQGLSTAIGSARGVDNGNGQRGAGQQRLHGIGV
jgi:hypothetical protein